MNKVIPDNLVPDMLKIVQRAEEEMFGPRLKLTEEEIAANREEERQKMENLHRDNNTCTRCDGYGCYTSVNEDDHAAVGTQTCHACRGKGTYEAEMEVRRERGRNDSLSDREIILLAALGR